MKLINHNKNNHTYDSTNNGSVMYGTIYMSPKEWNKVKSILQTTYKKAKRYSHTYTRDALAHTLNYYIPRYESLPSFCIGVTATEVIVTHFKLPRYKKQNYQIIITK